ncbi:MAG: hypothetical protein IJN56_01310 [Clostridia bacterium]|nr:hypothetical protein [Clostridia bacterium]
MMRSEKFFCKKCRRYFDELKIYEERHGFDQPPYERVAICPECNGDDYFKFDCFIEKQEVAERLLPIIMKLNRLYESLTAVFGNKILNRDLSDSLEMAVELIVEMFDFLDIDLQKRILKMDNDAEMEKIFMYLKGGL